LSLRTIVSAWAFPARARVPMQIAARASAFITKKKSIREVKER
jgi:hypothetical protein